MIKSAEELKGRKVEIDLTGPDGNAYVLLGHAVNFMKQLDYDCSHVKEILHSMKSSDYDHLVETFDKEFGDYVILYR